MFREKYRRDNELLKAPEQIPEGILNMKEKKTVNNKKRVISIAAITTAACLVIAAVAAIPMLNHGRGIDLPLEAVISIGDITIADDYSKIYDAFTEIRNAQDHYYAGYGTLTDGAMVDEIVTEDSVETDTPRDFNSMNGAVYDSETTATGAAGSAPDKDYSTTNTQKENVDEADIIKTDGQYIYRMTGGEVVIINAAEMKIVSRIKVSSDYSENKSFWLNANNIYISGDRIAVMYTKEVKRTDSEWWYDSYSGVMVYDITDRAAPALIGDCAQSGYLNDSRLIGDYIYMVTSYGVYREINEEQPDTYVPLLCINDEAKPMSAADICILPDPTTSTYAVITSVNINDGDDFTSTEAAFGYGSTVYADTENIVLAFSVSERETEETTENGESVTITDYTDKTSLISYAIGNGNIMLTASGVVPGTLLNQFSMDRHNGVLRVVTTSYSSTEKIYTDGIDRYEWESSTTNGLYTLDKSLNIIGALDGLAEDERVYSVRFSGDIGYFVTFRQVDPLFAVDLSDPTNPTLLSALKIPGFSQYMHPYADGLLFGLGMDADEETGRTSGLKLSMFDISDPTDVTEQNKLIMDDIHYSEALYNHKAIVISAARNIIAFPAGNGYMIFGYDEEGFHERFELQIDNYYGMLRGLFIGDRFFVSSDNKLWSYDMATFALQDELIISDNGKYVVMEDYVIDEIAVEEYVEEIIVD